MTKLFFFRSLADRIVDDLVLSNPRYRRELDTFLAESFTGLARRNADLNIFNTGPKRAIVTKMPHPGDLLSGFAVGKIHEIFRLSTCTFVHDRLELSSI